MKLDRSRPFGTVHPPYHGAYYMQDGRYFDHKGSRVLLPGEAHEPEPPKAKPKKGKAEGDRPAEQPPAGEAGADAQAEGGEGDAPAAVTPGQSAPDPRGA